MTTVGVVAHAGKTARGGPDELRRRLADAGADDPVWLEVQRSADAAPMARRAVADGVDLLVVWGGDGTVQRCLGAVAGTGVPLAVVPAGTANLLAANLGLPRDVAGAVEIALHGDRRVLDVGSLNGEPFAVVAGAGLDARTVAGASSEAKRRVGRLAYVVSAAQALDVPPVRARVEVDGVECFTGKVTCVLVGNHPRSAGGVTVFDGSRPDDGILEVGLATARTVAQWVRTAAVVALDDAEASPFVVTSRGRTIDVRFDAPVPVELDGSVREPTDHLHVEVHPGAVTMCVPAAARAG